VIGLAKVGVAEIIVAIMEADSVYFINFFIILRSPLVTYHS
jgi:hypothetical protein